MVVQQGQLSLPTVASAVLSGTHFTCPRFPEICVQGAALNSLLADFTVPMPG